jgi:hypothetical protein
MTIHVREVETKSFVRIAIPPKFGGGEGDISLQEDSLAISFSHGFE